MSGYISWKLNADKWIIATSDGEDELNGLAYDTQAECEAALDRYETARAERAADPYPDRIWPEAPMN